MLSNRVCDHNYLFLVLKKKNVESETHLNISSDTEDVPLKSSPEKLGETSISHQLIQSSAQRKIDKKLIRSKSFGDPVDPIDFHSIQNRIKSIMSLDDLSGDGIAIASTETAETGIWYYELHK